MVWIGHFSEKPGTSAFSGKERPEFERLLNACRTGRVNMIIVMYISRFSRQEPADAIPIISELLTLGVTIVSVTEGVFRKGNVLDLIHMIMRLDQAHNDSKNKSTAVKSAHDLARSLGGFVGKVPYGFELQPVTVPNSADRNKPIAIQRLKHRPSEVKIIKRIWQTIKAHKDEIIDAKRGKEHPGSLTTICRQLEKDLVPTRGATSGKRTSESVWDPATVKRILRDPRIAGFECERIGKVDDEGNMTRTLIGYKIKRDPETMEPLTLDCGEIIPRDEWYELQEWLSSRGRGKGLYRGEFLLSAMNLLYCECGGVMVGHGRNGDSKRKASYQCKGRRTIEGHGTPTIVTTILDDYVASRIFALIDAAESDPETILILAEATRRFGKRTEAPETAGERASLVQERADATTALNELYEDREAGGYSGPIGRRKFIELERKLNGRITGAEERLMELDEIATPRLPIGEWLSGEDGGSVKLADPTGEGSWWAKQSMNEKRDFIRLFVDRVEIIKSPNAGRGRFAPGVAARTTIKFAELPAEEVDEYEEAA